MTKRYASKEMIIVGMLAVLISYLNYKQGFKAIQTFSSDRQIDLGYTAIFDRIFINLDFIQLEYMEGNSPFHYIGPFLFFLSVICVGSYPFLALKKSYFQFIYVRATNKSRAILYMLHGFLVRITLFVGVYALSILVWLFQNDPSAIVDYKELVLKISFFSIAAIFISSSFTILFLFFYIKWDEIVAVIGVLFAVFTIFVTNVSFPESSIVFLGQDSYFSAGMITGLLLLVFSCVAIYMTKYKIE
jgi:hypothetical protein